MLVPLLMNVCVVLIECTAESSFSVSGWWSGVVVFGCFSGVSSIGVGSSNESCEWAFGLGGAEVLVFFSDVWVGVIPGHGAVGSDFGADAAVGFHVVVVSAEALEVAECGPAAGCVIDHVVDVASLCGDHAAGVAAVSIALFCGCFLVRGGYVFDALELCNVEDVAVPDLHVLRVVLIMQIAGVREFVDG